MTDPRTTVVVITRDRRDELLRTLDELAALPERPPVIVVDNASTDGTAEAVRGCHPGVRLLTPGRNLGACGRNLAARHVTTPYLAFCDDDSWWQAGSLAGAADLLDGHPQVVSVTARIVVHPPDAAPDDPGYEDPIVPELRESPLPRPGGLPGPVLGSFLAAATVLRTDAFRAAGGFSTRLWLGGEEELLAADLAASGWWLLYADDLTIHHQPSRRRDSTLRRRHGIRNTLWTTWLRRSAPAALRRTARLVTEVPKDRVTARAFAQAAAGLPWVLRERRPLPPPVEHRLRLLDDPQHASTARRYVG
ncbi:MULTISPECIES: glycosyltransferase family 2 protein [Streptomycetaceae]|uniref:Transferase n=1 Tax=Streptantibioticus cattleyicolor (strain ATCC 35852 / DSM 46488 / JCM 4925 / NBRC 14057 / NRRL 8057) TaxID=1003195 RepID=F8K2K2_STREN|nr:glycosyltransferase [Streptantibioticus cattleyicolor]AEW97513.1 transferase [Streptantibioticus cattleyicolor NRRL 8057 = DSM 46488]MYS61946.1 glycosyltransferase [Streptomyces sp. SID5468]CCB77837.1 putative transferase [Streptantibioticus cattleyicolor NRRL 8057 = DSM 46488]